MPRKTGEDQLLLLTLQMLRQLNYESRYRAWVAWRAVEDAQGQQPRGSWLCKADQRAEVRRHRVVHSRRRYLSVSRRKFVANAPMAAPHQDAIPHGRFSSSQDNTASKRCYSPHQKECGCDAEPTTTIMLQSEAITSKRKSTVSM